MEYKSVFDDNVRRGIPKIVSSFANSLGGVLVIGVEALNGVPQEPIQGFPTMNEELPLTIESSCLRGINPPVLPRITLIQSDVPNRSFIVVDVAESWEAPHAIENSKRVYVRTGNAGNPYDHADVDLIIDLVRRRVEPVAKRERFLTAARHRANSVVAVEDIHVEMSVVPSYPQRVLCAPNDIWTFLGMPAYRGARYFPTQTMRRIENGVASYNRQEEYSEINSVGLLFTRRKMAVDRDDDNKPVIYIRDFFHGLHKLLTCANGFYRRVGYRGNLEVRAVLKNFRMQRMQFLPDRFHFYDDDEFRCMQDEVEAAQRYSAELLHTRPADLIHDILGQICWSFWQGQEEFPAQALRDYIQETIDRFGIR